MEASGGHLARAWSYNRSVIVVNAAQLVYGLTLSQRANAAKSNGEDAVMTTTERPAVSKTATGIPVRYLAPGEMQAELEAELRQYEIRYEMPSERMAALVERGEMQETIEVLKWLSAYRALEFLNDRTRTDGSRGRTTKPSSTSS